MKILIIEKETGNAIGTYPVNMRGLNYTPSIGESYSLAWKSAVAEGDVDADERDKYTFRVKQEI